MTTTQPVDAQAGTAERPTIVVVSGNPRPQSRTLKVGRAVAERIAAGVESPTGSTTARSGRIAEIEVSAFATDLFRAPEQRPAELTQALQTLRQARLAVVATPVYKASYTGLLKAFLDHFRAGELVDLVAVGVVVAGGPAHTFVGDHHLRPLLTEIGAVTPTSAFTVTEGQLDQLGVALAEWAGRYVDVLARNLRPVSTPAGPAATATGSG